MRQVYYKSSFINSKFGILFKTNFKPFTQTVPTFNNPRRKVRVFENILGKGEHAGKPTFSPFPKMFSTILKIDSFRK